MEASIKLNIKQNIYTYKKGIVGLGLKPLSMLNGDTMLDNMFKQKKIKHKVFSFWTNGFDYFFNLF